VWSVLSLAVSAFGCASSIEFGTVPDGGTPSTWVNETANLAGVASECGNLMLLSSRTDQNRLTVGIAQQGLYSNANNALLWSAIGTGAGSDVITNRTTSILYDPAHPTTWWEAGIYNGFGVYRTDDDGATFKHVGSATHVELLSIDFTDPARQTMLAGVHESGQHLFLSTNGGSGWSDIGLSLPNTVGDTAFPFVIDSQTFLLGTSHAAGSAIYRSIDQGVHWAMVGAYPIHSRPLLAQDGNLYWMVENDGGLVKSVDQGQTWTKIISQPVNTLTPGLAELPDGRFLATGGGYALISKDHGATWTQVGSKLPYALPPTGIAYSKFRKAIYIWHFDCTATPDPVLPDGIMSTPFDYQTQ
jgi:hypothetical protein